MKKPFFILLSMSLLTNANAQEIILENNFDTKADFEKWTVMDLDGDHVNFEYDAKLSNYGSNLPGGGAVSWSVDLSNGMAATPDNLLISPTILLPAASELYFSVGSMTYTDYVLEKFSIYVLEENVLLTEIDQQEPLFTKRLEDGVHEDILLDLNKFANQKVKIVFRHYDSKDQSLIIFDNIKVVSKKLLTHDLTAQNSVKIYPNPVQNSFNLELNASINKANLNIEIYDLSGKKLMTFGPETKNYKINHLPKGIYLLKLNDGRIEITHKLIKQ